MILPQRRLGPFKVSAIGLGCMNISHAYGLPATEDEAARLLQEALDAGVSMLDTAALYGGGKNEDLLGRHVMHRRGDFLLASKCVLGLADGRRFLDGSPEAIAASIDRSLRNLRTDHIDLMYLHRVDPAVPIEDSVGALVQAREQGKIGALGLSEMSAATLRRAHAVHPIAAMQSEYSPWVRNPEVAVLDACEELGVGFVAFSPLGRGMLAGSIVSDVFHEKDIRRAMPRFQEPNLSRNMALAARFSQLAAANGMAPAQLSLGWLLARHSEIVAIPGTRSVCHLKENVEAVHMAVAPALVAAIDEIFLPGAVAGPRYGAASQAEIDTELLPEELIPA